MKTFLLAFLVSSFSGAAIADSQMSTQREGTYQVRLECREPNPEVCQPLEGPHTLTLMNVQSRNEVLVMIRPRSGRPMLYSFASSQVEEGGYAMQGVWNDGFPVAEIRLDLSDLESDVLGWIRDPRFVYDIRIRGTQVASTYGFFQVADGDPLPLSDVLGKYTGKLDGKDVTVIIQKSLVGSGVIASLKQGLVTYRFQEGVIDEQSRIVMLWRSESEEKKPLEKLILPLESREGSIATDGVSFLGTNGRFSRLQLKKE